MALSYGFYNSIDGDRTYNAEQMTAIFDGIITDGVFDNVSDLFATVPGTGRQVIVKPGKAWFNSTWTVNDTMLPLNLTPPDVTLKRYDAVVLEVNKTEAERKNEIKIVTGIPASTPAKPVLKNADGVYQHALAYILVEPGITSIAASKIENVVGQAECPFVTSVLESVPIDSLFAQWEGEFDDWFENLKAQLSDNVVANLQAQIDLKLNKSAKATASDLTVNATNNMKYITPYILRTSTLMKSLYDYSSNTRKYLRSVGPYCLNTVGEFMTPPVSQLYTLEAGCDSLLLHSTCYLNTANKFASVLSYRKGSSSYYLNVVIYSADANHRVEKIIPIPYQSSVLAFSSMVTKIVIAPSGDDENILYLGFYFQSSERCIYIINVSGGFAIDKGTTLSYPLVFNDGNSIAYGNVNSISIRDISTASGSTVGANGASDSYSGGVIMPLGVKDNVLYAVDIKTHNLYFFTLTFTNGKVTSVTRSATYSINFPSGYTSVDIPSYCGCITYLPDGNNVISNRIAIGETKVYSGLTQGLIMEYTFGNTSPTFITVSNRMSVIPVGIYGSYVFFTCADSVIRILHTTNSKSEFVYNPNSLTGPLDLRRSVLNPSTPLSVGKVDGNFIFNGTTFSPILYDLAAYGFALYADLMICGMAWTNVTPSTSLPTYYVGHASTIYMASLTNLEGCTGYYLIGGNSAYNTRYPTIFSVFGRDAVCKYYVKAYTQPIMEV